MGNSARCAIFVLPLVETREIPFVLAWDFPVTELHLGCSITVATPIFLVALASMPGRSRTLQQYQNWQKQIQSWQQPILDRGLPNWFKMALFNELYDLGGGTGCS